MSRWDKISLYKFQQIDAIVNRPGMSDLDKTLFSTCVVFDLTEYQLDHMKPAKANRLINRITKIFSEEFKPEPAKRIGAYAPNYIPSTYTLGQFITLAFYVSDNPLKFAHSIIATITGIDSEGQQDRAEFFLKQPVSKIIGSLRLFLERFRAFNNEYKDLFGVSTENASEISMDPFQRRFGWVFSATRVAEHNRITLDDAYALPIRQAFNDLAYLKAKDKFDEKQSKKK